MSTGENIKNAVEVLYKTYESIHKMKEDCQKLAPKAGYRAMSDRFMRYRSDVDTAGWLTSNMILAFQRCSNPDLEADQNWENAPVFSMEISLTGGTAKDSVPMLILSRFEYNDNISRWPAGCSPTYYWGFHQPVSEEFSRNFIQEDFDGYSIRKPVSQKVASSYWELKQVTFTSCPLLDLNSTTLQNRVFGTFDRLAEQN